MAKEEPFIARADAQRVRDKIARTGEQALELLAGELAVIKKHCETLPECWVDKFRKVADQLRRDYRLEGPAAAPAAAPRAAKPLADKPPDDPLAGLRLVDDDAAA